MEPASSSSPPIPLSAMRRGGASSIHQLEQAVGAERDLADLQPRAGERVLDGLGEQRAGRNGTGFAHALRAHGVQRRAGFPVGRLYVWDVGRGREQVVHERSVEQLSLLVVHELLIEFFVNDTGNT